MKIQTLSLIVLLLMLSVVSAHADGVLMPTDETYPGDFMKNRQTRIDVTLHGVIATVDVIQEFVHMGTDTTDAVYAFPLPPDARATRVLYWADGTVYTAVLKEREQAASPGTGEGGVAALVNDYIGRNGIKIKLKKIAPGNIQKIQLSYIQFCRLDKNILRYTYPLDTQNFTPIPLEHLQLNLSVESQAEIVSIDCPSHNGLTLIEKTDSTTQAQLIRSKAYTDRDLEIACTLEQDDVVVDFYSCAPDSLDGHFVLVVRPPYQINDDAVLQKRLLFVLNTSSSMFGYLLRQSTTAIETALDGLHPEDEFDILSYNNSVTSLFNEPVKATEDHLNTARSHLVSLETRSGSRLDKALHRALDEVPDDSVQTSIVVFTDGRSPLDPRDIQSRNTSQTSIFPVAIGDDIDRARLEMTARLNDGFVTYMSREDNITAKTENLLHQVSHPILKNVVYEWGQVNPSHILPPARKTTLAGSYYFITGRYIRTGSSGFAMAGTSVSGDQYYEYKFDFTDDPEHDTFARNIWAKEMIDAMERRIQVYGPTPTLRDSLVQISLRYNIRCRYTAYVADYQTEYTHVPAESGNLAVSHPESYIIGNYPNPFNPETTLTIVLHPGDLLDNQPVRLRVYNALGQLVAIIDLSHLGPGEHRIVFQGLDHRGRPLPSGIYYLHLQAGDSVHTLPVTLIR
jgi:Ca-activated chloride channel family protein